MVPDTRAKTGTMTGKGLAIQPPGYLLNAHATNDDKEKYLLQYREWATREKYKLGLGILFACFSTEAKDADPKGKPGQISVFSSNGIFWGSPDVMMIHFSTPALQKLFRTLMPDYKIAVAGADFRFNAPLAQKVLADNKEVK